MNPRSCAFRAPTVLVVDPEQSFRMLAAVVLRAEGCRVLSAATPEEAARLVVQQPAAVDVLFINGELPSGVDPAEEFRARWPGLEILYSFRRAGVDATTVHRRESLAGLCELVQKWYADREDASCDRPGVCPFTC